MFVRRALLFALIIACVPVRRRSPRRRRATGRTCARTRTGTTRAATRSRASGSCAPRAPWGDRRDEVIENDFETYASLARGSDENVADKANSKNWNGGYARTVLRDARLTDRLWVQLAAYGPPAPWTNGFTVRRLELCR